MSISNTVQTTHEKYPPFDVTSAVRPVQTNSKHVQIDACLTQLAKSLVRDLHPKPRSPSSYPFSGGFLALLLDLFSADFPIGSSASQAQQDCRDEQAETSIRMTEISRNPQYLSNMVQPAVRTIISSEDVWQGKTSPAERRKIQNRLNQRAWRQRRKLEKLRQGTARGAKSSSTAESALVVARKDSSTSSSSSPSNEDATTDAAEDTATYMYDTAMELAHPGPKRRRANGERMYAKHATLMALTYIGRRRRLFELQDEDMDELYGIFLMKAMHSGSDPMADSLLPLVQFNLFRGLMENMKTLGLSLGMMCDEECDSPIGTDPRFHSQTVWDIPVYLRPTETQLSVVHHPWLDVLPLPRMRDNLIKMDGKYDDEELCLDMVGDGNAPSGKGEMILWGEPWDPMNWEVTDVFVNKWRWVLEGCEELIRSSNYWRAQRGEKRMQVKLRG